MSIERPSVRLAWQAANEVFVEQFGRPNGGGLHYSIAFDPIGLKNMMALAATRALDLRDAEDGPDEHTCVDCGAPVEDGTFNGSAVLRHARCAACNAQDPPDEMRG